MTQSLSVNSVFAAPRSQPPTAEAGRDAVNNTMNANNVKLKRATTTPHAECEKIVQAVYRKPGRHSKRVLLSYTTGALLRTFTDGDEHDGCHLGEICLINRS